MVDEIRRRLHCALQSGSFDSATALAGEYIESLARTLQSTHNDQERVTVANEARSFLQDEIHLARVMRAHIAAQLAHASRIVSYKANSCAENTWHFDG